MKRITIAAALLLLLAVPAAATDAAPRCGCFPSVDLSAIRDICRESCRREAERPHDFCDIGHGAGRREFPFRSPICQRHCRRDCRRFVRVQQGHCCEPPLL